jgi:hypothetical protein
MGGLRHLTGARVRHEVVRQVEGGLSGALLAGQAGGLHGDALETFPVRLHASCQMCLREGIDAQVVDPTRKPTVAAWRPGIAPAHFLAGIPGG